MNISYQWLKDYIEFDFTPEQLQDKLTFAGIEVEQVTKLGKELEQIKIAKIIEREKHPNADKLSICKVDDGTDIKQVVCGAPNCDAGKLVAYAPIGTKFPEFTIKKAKLRGVVSFGMLCSEKELGLSDNHDGIMELSEDAPIGKDLAAYYDFKDTVYEVEITPNRPDLLGLTGVARDLSALLNTNLKLPRISFKESEKETNSFLKIDNQNPEKCLRYTARIITDIKVKESPEWLKRRLMASEINTINNVVDITNFVLMETGHPLHAFDYDKVSGHEIIIRNAKKGEKLLALNDKEYILDEHDLVIADAEKPIALAGIIGGKNSCVDSNTKNIVIESANFLYSTVRKTSRRLKIFTDAGYNFERGMSSEQTRIASDRAAQLLLENVGGSLLKNILDNYPVKEEKAKIKIRTERVEKILSVKIPAEKIAEYMKALGLELIEKTDKDLTFLAPYNRKDLTREIDLIEEIIRLYGYNNIPSKKEHKPIMDRKKFYLKRNIKDYLVNNGFNEVINWSFGNPEDVEKLKLNFADKDFVKIKNPMWSTFSIMRPSLIPDLMKNAEHNINHNQKNVKIFELAKCFNLSDKGIEEDYFCTGLLIGDQADIYWKDKAGKVNFYDVKGLVIGLLEIAKYGKLTLETSKDEIYIPGVNADIILNKQKIGSFGEIDPKIAEQYSIKESAFIFEININKMMEFGRIKKIKFKEIPKAPFVNRDLSFIVPNSYSVGELTSCMLGINRNLIRDVILFDEYKGKGISDGFRSLSFNLTIGTGTKNLTDENLNNLFDKIIKELKKKFQIEMR